MSAITGCQPCEQRKEHTSVRLAAPSSWHSGFQFLFFFFFFFRIFGFIRVPYDAVTHDEPFHETGAGLGPLQGKIWRVGLMGESARIEHVETLLDALSSLNLRAKNPNHQDHTESATVKHA